MTALLPRGLLLSLFLAVTAGCTTVPLDYPKQESQAIPAADNTVLGNFAAQWRSLHPGHSGFMGLPKGLDGLGARLKGLDRAQVSVDAQYFLLKPDEAGRLFLGKLLYAADRGVRVRLLVDDIFTPRDDHVLATLSSHENIEIRLFNPLSRRSPVFWSMLWDFTRTNRRMHNKAFIVDGAMAIVGGRNIAEEYFELKPDGNFDDFEVLTIGPVVDELSASFDEFWNSRLSLPVEALGGRVDPERLEQWRKTMEEVIEGSRPSAYGRAINSELLQELINGERGLEPAKARVVSDSPQKLKEVRGEEQFLAVAAALMEAVQAARQEVTIITPYFLLGERGRSALMDIANSGVQVRVITNSLASTNHVPVHAHYRKYRKQLLQAGVQLYELRADRQPGWKNGSQERMTLHTKLFELDGETVVLGSVNLDPRSIEINSELIVFVESSGLSSQLLEFLRQDLPEFTWRLQLNEKGYLRWHYEGKSGVQTARGEPGASIWRRMQANIYRLLPIERQL